MPTERDIIIEESVMRSQRNMITNLAFYESVVVDTFGKDNVYAIIARNYIRMARMALGEAIKQYENSQD